MAESKVEVPKNFTGMASRDSGFVEMEGSNETSTIKSVNVRETVESSRNNTAAQKQHRLDRLRRKFSLDTFERKENNNELELSQGRCLDYAAPENETSGTIAPSLINQAPESSSTKADREDVFAVQDSSNIRNSTGTKTIADMFKGVFSRNDELKVPMKVPKTIAAWKEKLLFFKGPKEEEYPLPRRPSLKRTMMYFADRPQKVDATLEQALSPGTTFHYAMFPPYFEEHLPEQNHILHVRDKAGNEYLTIEYTKGHRYVSAGLLNFIAAEVALPQFISKEVWITDFLVFSASMAIGSEELLRSLLYQFASQKTSLAASKTILLIVRRWLRSQPEDFTDNAATARTFRALIRQADRYIEFEMISQDMKTTFTESKRKLVAYEEHLKEDEDDFMDHEVMTKKFYQILDLKPPNYKLLEVPALDIAKYFAALDWVLFRDATAIRTLQAWWRQEFDDTVEFYHKNQWGSPQKKPWWSLADRVDRILRRKQMLIHWVQFEALQPQKLEHRVEVIEKMIDIARYLFDYQDFHGAHCIVQSLTTAGVDKLSASWKNVSTKSVECLESLKRSLSEDDEDEDNSGRYKDTLKEAMENIAESGPVIPIFEVFLEELTSHVRKRNHWHKEKEVTSKGSHVHLDYPVDYLGTLEVPIVSEKYPPLPESPAAMSFRNGLLDIYKFQMVIQAHAPYRLRSKRPYKFSKHLKMSSWGLRLNVPGIQYYYDNKERENDGSKGFDKISEAVEKRILLAWGLRFNAEISELRRLLAPAAYREHTLEILYGFITTNAHGFRVDG